jgi:hypothetical protein
MDEPERDTYLRWIHAELSKRKRLGHYQPSTGSADNH